MHNELTKNDIRMMQEELDHIRLDVMPGVIEEVKRTRAFGDLSENYEYKTAKQEKNRNESRIRYLSRMIASAVVISAESQDDAVGLFDQVELYFPEDEETQTIRLVTTLRQNVLKGLISKESPLGQAILGHKAGETVTVTVNEHYSYPVEIRSIEKGQDDESLEISRY